MGKTKRKLNANPRKGTVSRKAKPSKQSEALFELKKVKGYAAKEKVKKAEAAEKMRKIEEKAKVDLKVEEKAKAVKERTSNIVTRSPDKQARKVELKSGEKGKAKGKGKLKESPTERQLKKDSLDKMSALGQVSADQRHGERRGRNRSEGDKGAQDRTMDPKDSNVTVAEVAKKIKLAKKAKAEEDKSGEDKKSSKDRESGGRKRDQSASKSKSDVDTSIKPDSPVSKKTVVNEDKSTPEIKTSKDGKSGGRRRGRSGSKSGGDADAEDIFLTPPVKKTKLDEDKAFVVEAYPVKKPNYKNSNSGTWVVASSISNARPDDHFDRPAKPDAFEKISEDLDDLLEETAEADLGEEDLGEEADLGEEEDLGDEDLLDGNDDIFEVDDSPPSHDVNDVNDVKDVNDASVDASGDIVTEKQPDDPDEQITIFEKKSSVVTKTKKKKKKIDISEVRRTFTADSDSVLVLLRRRDVLTIHGKVRAQCISGSVECLGYTFAHDKQYSIFSPDCAALANISVVSTTNVTLDDLSKKFPKLQGPELPESLEVLGLELACVLLTYLTCKTTEFITQIQPFTSLYTGKIPRFDHVDLKWSPPLEARLLVDTSGLGVKFSLGHTKAVDHFVSSLDGESSPIVLLCGAKNVGKSTLGRYLVNRSLGKCNKIAYLDCDIGQTEFTPPGCVSLTVVSDPLFGPAFTHQKKPLRNCFVGLVSPADNYEHYFKCLTYVFEAYRALPEPRPPLVVNTMGWISGLGLNILGETVRMVKPDLVIQLMASNQKMPLIDAQFLSTTPSLNAMLDLTGSHPSVYRVKEHQLMTIPVQIKPNRGMVKYKAADQRSLTLLSYLSGIYWKHGKADLESLGPFFTWTPYRRPWNSLALHVCHLEVRNSQIMYALNGSVVALCVVDKKQMLVPRDDYLPRFLEASPVCSCLGFGFVRAIDPVTKLFHILTPMIPEDLVQVNCLLKGLVDLPESMIRDQPGTSQKTFPPYVEFVTSIQGAKIVKERRHLKTRTPNGGKT